MRKVTTPATVADRYYLSRVLMELDSDIAVLEKDLERRKADRDKVTLWGEE